MAHGHSRNYTTLTDATLATAVPAVASEQPSPMAGAFGNTILSISPDGIETRTYVEPDGTYRSVTGGVESSGTWAVVKGQICYSAPGAAPLCALGPKKKVGSKWKIFVTDDRYYSNSIVAGREGK